jgi:hypothetical protein
MTVGISVKGRHGTCSSRSGWYSISQLQRRCFPSPCRPPDSISHRVVRRLEREAQRSNSVRSARRKSERPDTGSKGLSRPSVNGVDLSSHPSGKFAASLGRSDRSFIPSENARSVSGTTPSINSQGPGFCWRLTVRERAADQRPHRLRSISACPLAGLFLGEGGDRWASSRS